jgi:hypothetical protein
MYSCYEGYRSASPDTISQATVSSPSQKQNLAAVEARKESRIRFDLGSSILFLLALHGISAFKVFLILYLNYQIATALPRQHVPVATWVFNIAILFANESCRGYPLASVARLILPPETTVTGQQQLGWGGWLDSYGGLIPRWEVLFNICVLRLISFNFDYCWSFDQSVNSAVEVSGSTSLGIFMDPLQSNPNQMPQHVLTRSRRKTSTPPPSQNATASTLHLHA